MYDITKYIFFLSRYGVPAKDTCGKEIEDCIVKAPAPRNVEKEFAEFPSAMPK